MTLSLYSAATGMEAQQLNLNTIANNLANVNTTGFKRTRAEFQDLLSETIVQAQPAGPQGGGQPAPLQIGLGAGDKGFAGEIAEILVYSRALADTERVRLEKALIGKYFGNR